MNPTTREELDNYAQIEFSVVGTEGAIENEFKVYKKKELLKRLDELLPEKFGFSVVFALNPKEEGI
ncbi:MAG TPA: hypothetical protein ENI23_14670 [bacterium]|nr:hypothetical protein [bacterium]